MLLARVGTCNHPQMFNPSDFLMFRWLFVLIQRQIRHLDGSPAQVNELAAEAVEDFATEGAPLLSSNDLSP